MAKPVEMNIIISQFMSFLPTIKDFATAKICSYTSIIISKNKGINTKANTVKLVVSISLERITHLTQKLLRIMLKEKG